MEAEGLLQCLAEARCLERADCAEQHEIRQVLHPRVRTFARQRIGVHLFGEMRFNWIEPQFRWFDAGECQDVFSHDDVRLAQDRIRERDVDAEALAVDLAREPAHSAIAEAVLSRAVEVHLGPLSVRLNFEGHEIAEISSRGFSQLRKQVVRRSREA